MPETLQAQSVQEKSQRPDSGLARIFQGLAFMAFWIALLFVSAGTTHWLRGWICAVTYGVTMLAMGFIVSRINPALMPARAKWRRRDAKLSDRIILAIYLPLTILLPAIAALDAIRYRWLPMPFWTLYPGLAIFFFCVVLIGWVMAVNPWAEASVRIQSDRGHQVVHSGPYRFVRHPMYVGMILMYLAVALMLGSNWALALAGFMAVILIVRTALEDRTLQRELPGYREFTGVTRWRLLPGIW